MQKQSFPTRSLSMFARLVCVWSPGYGFLWLFSPTPLVQAESEWGLGQGEEEDLPRYRLVAGSS